MRTNDPSYSPPPERDGDHEYETWACENKPTGGGPTHPTSKTMSPERQQAAIFKACGWTEVLVPLSGEPWFRHPSGALAWSQPDYLGDLNAMAEAENWLRTQGRVWWGYETRITKCATAAQRAEAFLRTLNLWEP